MSLNKYLFGTAFKNLHGISVDDALRGVYVVRTGKNITKFEPHEVDEMEAEYGLKPKSGKPWAERHAELVRNQTPEKAIKAYQYDEHLVGNDYQVAANIRDFTKLLEEHSELSPTRLYRGAARPAEEQVLRVPDEPISTTTDRFVAKSFASQNFYNSKTNRSSKGTVYTYNPNTLRGINIAQFGGVPRTVGRNRRLENEWIIHPSSFKKEQ